MSLQQDQTQQLVMLCHQLEKQGLQPGVGLLRSKAPFKVSVTQAIEAIKQFNNRVAPPKSDSLLSEREHILALEKRVGELESAVALLEKRIQTLAG